MQPDTLPAQLTTPKRLSQLLAAYAIALLAILLAGKFRLIFNLNLNWDEFYTLSKIYQFTDNLQHAGEANGPSSSFINIFYAWLIFIPGYEIEVLQSARIATFIFHLAGLCFFYHILQRRLGYQAALFGILSYAAFSFYIAHGLGLRYDNPAVVFCLAALALQKPQATRRVRILQAGLFVIAMAFTIKSVIFLAMLGCLMLFDHRRTMKIIPIARGLLIVSVVSFIGWYGTMIVIDAWITGSDPYLQGEFKSFTNQIESKEIFIDSSRTDTSLKYFYRTLHDDWLLWYFAFLAPLLAIYKLAVSPSTTRLLLGLAIGGLFLPLFLGMLFYRNMYPYFYIMLAPAIIFAAAWSLNLVLNPLAPAARTYALMLVYLITFMSGAGKLATLHRDSYVTQRETIETIHKMFPEPVVYNRVTCLFVEYATGA